MTNPPVSQPNGVVEAPERIWLSTTCGGYSKTRESVHDVEYHRATSPDSTALCTPVLCGTQPILPPARVGCGGYILSELDLFRCGDCTVPFHRECLRAHFASHEADSITEKAQRAARTLIYDDEYIVLSAKAHNKSLAEIVSHVAAIITAEFQGGGK